MGKIDRAIHELHRIDRAASRDTCLNRLHPLSKLTVTIVFTLFTLSFDKYDLTGTVSMALYPFIIMLLADISFVKCLKRTGAVMLLVCCVGAANPFLDRSVLFHIQGLAVTGGMISMLTLVIKGILAVCASYILIITTTIENICYALRCVHVPKTLVTVIMLIYRYIIVLLKEAERITQAYSLRAPGQKGIHFRAWGTLAGQMLLRSMDRAELVYESMLLRGYDGDFLKGRKKRMNAAGLLYIFAWCAVFCALRFIPVLNIIGAQLSGG